MAYWRHQMCAWWYDKKKPVQTYISKMFSVEKYCELVWFQYLDCVAWLFFTINYLLYFYHYLQFFCMKIFPKFSIFGVSQLSGLTHVPSRLHRSCFLFPKPLLFDKMFVDSDTYFSFTQNYLDADQFDFQWKNAYEIV